MHAITTYISVRAIVVHGTAKEHTSHETGTIRAAEKSAESFPYMSMLYRLTQLPWRAAFPFLPFLRRVLVVGRTWVAVACNLLVEDTLLAACNLVVDTLAADTLAADTLVAGIHAEDENLLLL